MGENIRYKGERGDDFENLKPSNRSTKAVVEWISISSMMNSDGGKERILIRLQKVFWRG